MSKGSFRAALGVSSHDPYASKPRSKRTAPSKSSKGSKRPAAKRGGFR